MAPWIEQSGPERCSCVGVRFALKPGAVAYFWCPKHGFVTDNDPAIHGGSRRVVGM